MLVGREGIEPSTIRLKVECSTAELQARRKPGHAGAKRRGPYAQGLDRTSRKGDGGPNDARGELDSYAPNPTGCCPAAPRGRRLREQADADCRTDHPQGDGRGRARAA